MRHTGATGVLRFQLIAIAWDGARAQGRSSEVDPPANFTCTLPSSANRVCLGGEYSVFCIQCFLYTMQSAQHTCTGASVITHAQLETRFHQMRHTDIRGGSGGQVYHTSISHCQHAHQVDL